MTTLIKYFKDYGYFGTIHDLNPNIMTISSELEFVSEARKTLSLAPSLPSPPRSLPPLSPSERENMQPRLASNSSSYCYLVGVLGF